MAATEIGLGFSVFVPGWFLISEARIVCIYLFKRWVLIIIIIIGTEKIILKLIELASRIGFYHLQ